jgi:hypothetical protein
MPSGSWGPAAGASRLVEGRRLRQGAVRGGGVVGEAKEIVEGDAEDLGQPGEGLEVAVAPVFDVAHRHMAHVEGRRQGLNAHGAGRPQGLDAGAQQAIGRERFFGDVYSIS